MMRLGKIGCLVDLSRGSKADINLSRKVIYLIAKLMQQDGTNILCIETKKKYSSNPFAFMGKKTM